MKALTIDDSPVTRQVARVALQKLRVVSGAADDLIAMPIKSRRTIVTLRHDGLN